MGERKKERKEEKRLEGKTTNQLTAVYIFTSSPTGVKYTSGTKVDGALCVTIRWDFLLISALFKWPFLVKGNKEKRQNLIMSDDLVRSAAVIIGNVPVDKSLSQSYTIQLSSRRLSDRCYSSDRTQNLVAVHNNNKKTGNWPYKAHAKPSM